MTVDYCKICNSPLVKIEGGCIWYRYRAPCRPAAVKGKDNDDREKSDHRSHHGGSTAPTGRLRDASGHVGNGGLVAVLSPSERDQLQRDWRLRLEHTLRVERDNWAPALDKLKDVYVVDVFNVSRIAGKWMPLRRQIHMNARLCSTVERYDKTLGHEWAHALAHAAFGPKVNHGWQWQHVMRLLGLQPTRCHSYDIAEAFPEAFQRIACINVACGQAITLGARMRNKIAAGERVYVCGRCRTRIPPGAVV